MAKSVAPKAQKVKEDPLKPLQYSAEQLADAVAAGFKLKYPEQSGKKVPTISQMKALVKRRNAWVKSLLKYALKGKEERKEATKVVKSYGLAGTKRRKKRKA